MSGSSGVSVALAVVEAVGLAPGETLGVVPGLAEDKALLVALAEVEALEAGLAVASFTPRSSMPRSSIPRSSKPLSSFA